MGDVDVKQVKNIDPVTIKEIDKVANIEPLRIAKIAPAAVHVKELNNIDPITIESLRVDGCAISTRSGSTGSTSRISRPSTSASARCPPWTSICGASHRSLSACTRSSSCRRST